ncbi:UDP-N-acetylglucosamine 2-epimerase (non-hydrolyzing) [candidate division WOR-3 bacterium]|nr:UDP-N-acetylglucosamine 2-epimerase (non-hydrolyzing) [candidate division WOR-3 bacterium]
MKLIHVVGARPNFMKIAPIMRVASRYDNIEQVLVHTGQHYDDNMSQWFFDELGIKQPDVNLEVGSGSHGEQTGEIMKRFEKFIMKEGGDVVVVVGDVNSTIACGLVAAKLQIPLAHVEAGLRSFDRSMPEEINRLLTDSISDYLFTPAEEANENLKKEGVSEEKIHLVGDIMIDTLIWEMERTADIDKPPFEYLEAGKYAALTLHRPSNVDNEETFKEIVEALNIVSKKIKIVFPAHPRTQERMRKFKIDLDVDTVKVINPISYRDFLRLYKNSKFVLTDSGSIQQETTYLNIPCLTIRENTERPFTITKGTNVLVGKKGNVIVEESLKILNGKQKESSGIPLWDGKTAERIIKVFLEVE